MPGASMVKFLSVILFIRNIGGDACRACGVGLVPSHHWGALHELQVALEQNLGRSSEELPEGRACLHVFEIYEDLRFNSFLISDNSKTPRSYFSGTKCFCGQFWIRTTKLEAV